MNILGALFTAIRPLKSVNNIRFWPFVKKMLDTPGYRNLCLQLNKTKMSQ
jgi:hypothetical protein